MRILVTGATGTLGRVLVPRLLADRHTVRAMSRRPRAAGPDDPVEWVMGELAGGAGLDRAVADVSAVVHLASAARPGRRADRVDVGGTARLVAAAGRAGVRHLLYVSIVGVDRVPFGYYRRKLTAERLIAEGPTPWTVLRATQFPQLLDDLLRVSARLGPVIGDRAVVAQPVDPRDVADRISELLAAGPDNRIHEYGGPQVLRFDEAARSWAAARHRSRRLLPVRVPGRLGRVLRSGGLTTATRPTGTRTWADYLAARYGNPTVRR